MSKPNTGNLTADIEAMIAANATVTDAIAAVSAATAAVMAATKAIAAAGKVGTATNIASSPRQEGFQTLQRSVGSGSRCPRRFKSRVNPISASRIIFNDGAAGF